MPPLPRRNRPYTHSTIRSCCYGYLLTLLMALISTNVSALGEESWLATSARGNLVLVEKQQTADIIIDSSDLPGVKRAANNLQSDIEKVTGKKPSLIHSTEAISASAIIIGTLGNSQLIDALVAAKKIDITKIQNQWDAYQIQVVEKPLPNIERALVIIGANKRGTMYGIYSLSEQIGVSPWYWWADVPITKKDALIIDSKIQITEIPKVKYRGIFLNDEAPALTNWVAEKYGNYNHHFYEKVFELLLRLKANFLWPAMWNNAFADDDPQNMILADEYGIVMSTSHHEPMMRADKEWNRYGKGPWEYSKNPENLYNFWVDGVKRNKPYESIYTLGMRGQQDEPMSEGENIGLLEKIVHDQREILTNQFGKDKVTEIPQVWALYKEVQGFYERGMRVLIDQVLNHSSDQHPWFVESRSSRDNDKADWYVWADPKPDGTVPNNWLSVFGGPAWSWDSRRRQYYLHNFLSSQPDLNFHCPAVQDQLLDDMEFWLKLGVDGFRLDAANFYFHDLELRDNPPNLEIREGSIGVRVDNPYAYQRHIYDKTRPENLAFLRRLRALLQRYPGASSVAEIGCDESLRTMAAYTSGGDTLHMAYSFDLLTAQCSPAFIRHTIESIERELSDGWPCWSVGRSEPLRHCPHRPPP